MRNLILQLFEIGAIQFGSFTLKSGISSPIYLDLRTIISFPKLLIEISEALFHEMRSLPCDLLCGVPYTALPLATAISIRHTIPMILRRKERKEHGLGKMVEGVFRKNDRCIILEDIITSGSSILETARDLQKEGLLVEDAVVFIDREQGGAAELAKVGIRVHAVYSLSKVLDLLLSEGKINAETAQIVRTFLLDF